jgi:hypothetical protein
MVLNLHTKLFHMLYIPGSDGETPSSTSVDALAIILTCFRNNRVILS